MNIDIPQLSSSGIEFGNHSFQFVDSIQSSSRFSNFSFFHRCNWTWVGYSADTTGKGACSIMIQMLSIVLISSLCFFFLTQFLLSVQIARVITTESTSHGNTPIIAYSHYSHQLSCSLVYLREIFPQLSIHALRPAFSVPFHTNTFHWRYWYKQSNTIGRWRLSSHSRTE